MARSTLHPDSDTTIAQTLREWLARLGLGEPVICGDILLHPLTGPCAGERDYLLLHEAIEKDLLEIREDGPGGIVSQVTAFNRGPQPVLILEGQSIVGAKQNRVVVETVLVAQGSMATVPVGCVESGRWHARTQKFGAGDMHVASRIRRRTLKEAARAGHVDQSRLWADVSHCMRVESVESPTEDYMELIAARKRQVDELIDGVQAVPGQIGVLVTAGGSFIGLELVSHPDAWHSIAKRLLPSYVLGVPASQKKPRSWWDPRNERVDAGPNLAELMHAVADAHVRMRASHGLGVQLSLAGAGFEGGGLWFGDEPLHLAVFAE